MVGLVVVLSAIYMRVVWMQGYLTHVHQVEGLRGMLSIPARLESTSLVFVYGLDLFYTPTAPSKTYDSLTEEFSYALLLITIVVLVVAIAVTYVLSERKELAEKWKWSRERLVQSPRVVCQRVCHVWWRKYFQACYWHQQQTAQDETQQPGPGVLL